MMRSLSSAPDKSPWLPHFRPRVGARLRLFCFPHAGGSAVSFHPWVGPLAAAGIDVCAVQPPGREGRIAEPPIDRMPEFVERLIEALDPYFDVPFAFFGHSLGALAAHELALALERKERAAPKRLFASAHRAPSLPQRRPPIHAQSDDEMIESLRALGGTPSAVFEDRELIELFLPTFRADFKMTETHQSGPLAPLRCPITALGGTHDDRVDEEELGAWSRHTARGFDCRVFDGGHFYLKEYERDVLGSITLRLDAVNGDESRSA